MEKDIIKKTEEVIKEEKSFSKEITKRTLNKVKIKHSHLLERLKDA